MTLAFYNKINLLQIQIHFPVTNINEFFFIRATQTRVMSWWACWLMLTAPWRTTCASALPSTQMRSHCYSCGSTLSSICHIQHTYLPFIWLYKWFTFYCLKSHQFLKQHEQVKMLLLIQVISIYEIYESLYSVLNIKLSNI